MKGKQNWIDKTASYRMFVMGDNRWRDEPYWPLQQTREKTLYLTSEGRANTPAGDGVLVAQQSQQGGRTTTRTIRETLFRRCTAPRWCRFRRTGGRSPIERISSSTKANRSPNGLR